MWQPGDIVAFQTPGFTSAMIRAVTFGSVSHVGIVCDHEGGLALYESTTLAAGSTPCIVQGKPVKGVQVHWVHEITQRPGKVWRYPIAQPLSDVERRRLKIFLASQIGKTYDYRGALESGPRLLRWASWLWKTESLDSVFCSELCAAAYHRLLRFDIRTASVYNPNNMLRRMLRRGSILEPERVPNENRS